MLIPCSVYATCEAPAIKNIDNAHHPGFGVTLVYENKNEQ